MTAEPFMQEPFQPAGAGAAEIQPISELRPVPPPPERRATAAPPHASRANAGGGRRATPYRPRPAVGGWPVDDPYSARRRQRPQWLTAYVAALVFGDVLAAGAGVALAALTGAAAEVSLLTVVTAVVVAWPVLQVLSGSYAERRLGTGSAEYRRVAIAGLLAVAVTGYAALAAPHLDRLILLGAPAATLLTLLGRLVNRSRLHVGRRRGLMSKQVVLVGRDVAVLDLFDRIRRDPAAGLTVVGACVPNPMQSSRLVELGIPLLGALGHVGEALDSVRADAVLVASASETAGQYLRDLAWRLEGTGIDLLVAPGVIEVAPERLQVRPTLSVPLLQIAEPEFRGHRRVLKSLIDRLVAATLLFLAAPVFLLVALAVKLTSPGPVFFRHRRVGKRGREFPLLKFRSMVVDADSRLEALMVLSEGNEVQFKMRRDPRITRVGHLLRRSSLDELPQLVNVLLGHMSLVGPRPHVTREVAQYGSDMYRRLLVKPGITGLWQVSGRSDLSWAESVELDVRYVENWSLGLDLTILWRTVRAVLQSAGAY